MQQRPQFRQAIQQQPQPQPQRRQQSEFELTGDFPDVPMSNVRPTPVKKHQLPPKPDFDYSAEELGIEGLPNDDIPEEPE